MKEETHDLYTFFPNTMDTEKTQVQCMDLNDGVLGRYFDEEGSDIGHKYQIVLCKDHAEDEDKWDHLDQFEAILTHPITYIRNLAKMGWYGIIVRKSEKSDKIVDHTVAKIKELL